MKPRSKGQDDVSDANTMTVARTVLFADPYGADLPNAVILVMKVEIVAVPSEEEEEEGIA